MAVLLIILALTMGLSIRALVFGGRLGIADPDTGEGPWVVEACARTFLLVLLSLFGLLLLGLTYGNVLGAAHTGQ